MGSWAAGRGARGWPKLQTKPAAMLKAQVAAALGACSCKGAKAEEPTNQPATAAGNRPQSQEVNHVYKAKAMYGNPIQPPTNRTALRARAFNEGWGGQGWGKAGRRRAGGKQLLLLQAVVRLNQPTNPTEPTNEPTGKAAKASKGRYRLIQ